MTLPTDLDLSALPEAVRNAYSRTQPKEDIMTVLGEEGEQPAADVQANIKTLTGLTNLNQQSQPSSDVMRLSQLKKQRHIPIHEGVDEDAAEPDGLVEYIATLRFTTAADPEELLTARLKRYCLDGSIRIYHTSALS